MNKSTIAASHVELDVTGQIQPGWNVIVTYAHQDARTTVSNYGDVGFRQPFVPDQLGSLWSTRDLFKRGTKNLRVGGGLSGQTSVMDYANVLTGPGFATFDAMAAYGFTRGKAQFTTQLNVTNILDKNYFLPGFGGDGTAYGQFATTRSLTGSIGVSF